MLMSLRICCCEVALAIDFVCCFFDIQKVPNFQFISKFSINFRNAVLRRIDNHFANSLSPSFVKTIIKESGDENEYFFQTGDRIAIMSNGVVQCCGSSLFLKNKYGVGYHMVIVKSEDCQVKQITAVVKKHVSHAKLENDVGEYLKIL